MNPTTSSIQAEIRRLCAERDICILAHSYQSHAITEVADFVGDSFALSVKAQKVPNKTLILCGVRFMAETAKILSPDKTVILSAPDAGCPMAEQMSRDDILAIKRAHPDHAVVAYVNTTAELKTIADVCVTSSSAVKIVKALDAKKILFIPDCNLGSYVAAQCPEKEIMLLQGGCPIHASVTAEEAAAAKAAHPGAKLLVHPECIPAVVAQADVIGSTKDILDYAMASDDTEFIIGTELSIVEHLQFACPDKHFYPLSAKLICANMKLTTLIDLYHCVLGDGGAEIVLDDDTLRDARRCIDAMIALG
ncbi:MAG: quinolinate synthase NadA [Clostridia bacterium]|nr:quinolinate synthase NadA [Clostridia bacterium]